MYSISEISIEVSELHAGANGRLEITCVSTIPASVGPGEQYADYKTTSVKGEKTSWLSFRIISSLVQIWKLPNERHYGNGIIIKSNFERFLTSRGTIQLWVETSHLILKKDFNFQMCMHKLLQFVFCLINFLTSCCSTSLVEIPSCV